MKIIVFVILVIIFISANFITVCVSEFKALEKKKEAALSMNSEQFLENSFEKMLSRARITMQEEQHQIEVKNRQEAEEKEKERMKDEQKRLENEKKHLLQKKKEQERKQYVSQARWESDKGSHFLAILLNNKRYPQNYITTQQCVKVLNNYKYDKGENLNDYIMLYQAYKNSDTKIDEQEFSALLMRLDNQVEAVKRSGERRNKINSFLNKLGFKYEFAELAEEGLDCCCCCI